LSGGLRAFGANPPYGHPDFAALHPGYACYPPYGLISDFAEARSGIHLQLRRRRLQGTTPDKRVAVSGDCIPRNLKQQLLLFDRVAVVSLDTTIGIARVFAGQFEDYKDAVNDLEFCADNGLVFEAESSENAARAISKTGHLFTREDLLPFNAPEKNFARSVKRTRELEKSSRWKIIVFQKLRMPILGSF
jgi:hypothetical protein